MGLQVVCPGCKGKLAVKDELLGKQIKCPTCSTVLSIAAPKESSAPKPASTPTPQPNPKPAPAAAPSSPAPAAGNDGGSKILVACSCGSKLRVPATAVGKKVRCPKCKNAIPVTGPGTSPGSVAPAAPAAPVGFDQPEPLSEADADPFGQPAAGGGSPFDQPAAGGASPFDAGDFGAAPAAAAGSPFDMPAGGAAPAAGGFGAPAAGGGFSAPAGGGGFSAPAAGGGGFSAPAGGGGFGAPAGDAATGGGQKPKRKFGEYISNRSHIGVIAMMLLGPLLGVFGLQTKRMLDALEANGAVVEGVVQDGYEKRGRRGSRSYVLTVSYAVNSQTYSDDFSVKGSFYESYGLGQNVTVKYLPDDPEQAILPGGSTDSSFMLYLGIGMFVLGLGGFLYTIFVGDINL